MVRTVYLVRHTQYDTSRNILPGRLPVPLSEEGKREAEHLRAYFARLEIQHIYSSAVLRCQETSEFIAHKKIPITYDKRLLETFSAYQGYWDQWAWKDFYGHKEDLGGELYVDIQARMADCFNDVVRHCSGNLILCSHGDPLYFLYQYLAGLPIEPEYVPGEEVVQPVEYQPKGSIRPVLVDTNGKVREIQTLVTQEMLQLGAASSTSPTSDQERVYAFMRSVPAGRVVTYGDVALAVGLNTPRLVGRYLHANSSPQNAPCHRVVFSDGKLAPAYAFGGEEVQGERLRNEGVAFLSDGRVDLFKSRWRGR